MDDLQSTTEFVSKHAMQLLSNEQTIGKMRMFEETAGALPPMPETSESVRIDGQFINT